MVSVRTRCQPYNPWFSLYASKARPAGWHFYERRHDMWGKVIGVFVTLGVVGYMFHAMNASNTAIQKAMDNNPATKEEKAMLKQEGIDPNDPDAVKKYAAKKAKEIEEYQHSADGLTGDGTEKTPNQQPPAQQQPQ